MPWAGPWLLPTASPRSTSPVLANPVVTRPLTVTYIPPLIDGASGTVPRAQKPVLQLLRLDTGSLVAINKSFVWSLVEDWDGLLAQERVLSWADVRDVLCHFGLAALELYMLVTGLPLWIVLPGGLFFCWLAACTACIYVLSWILNGDRQVVECADRSQGLNQRLMIRTESEEDKWIFVGSAGLSSRRLTQETLPSLCKLFSRTITAIHTPTYGVPFDILPLLAQRCFDLPTQANCALHAQLRGALLDSSTRRVVVLAHHHGAVTASQVVSRLCADLPQDKLVKLEVFTFGGAAAEFVLAVGESNLPDELTGEPPEQRGPHVEHFALAADPFARLGVLHGVRESLDGRFCGGVFVIGNGTGAGAGVGAGIKGHGRTKSMTMTSHGSKAAEKRNMADGLTGLTMEDYMAVLFPARTPGRVPAPSALDGVMAIDSDTSEKRELAALVNYRAQRAQASGGGSDDPVVEVRAGGSKRLSWTALGATVETDMSTAMNGVRDGLKGVECARNGCRNCDGHRGREVSWLVRYVSAGQYVEQREVMDAAAIGRVQ